MPGPNWSLSNSLSDGSVPLGDTVTGIDLTLCEKPFVVEYDYGLQPAIMWRDHIEVDAVYDRLAVVVTPVIMTRTHVVPLPASSLTSVALLAALAVALLIRRRRHAHHARSG